MDLSVLISTQLAQALVLAPIIIGLVGTVKSLGVDSRYAPSVSIVLGIGLSFLLQVHWLVGILAGLSASGLYSGVKATVAPTQ